MRITVASFAAFTLQLLGFAGLADSFVKWRTFFEAGFFGQYRSVLIDAFGPLQQTQLALIGYALSCLGFFVAALGTNQDHLKYLRSLNVPIPDHYRAVETIETPETFAVEVTQRNRFIAMRSSVLSFLRLASAALVWPLFLLWALYVWFLSPTPKRRRVHMHEITEEQHLEEVAAFAFDDARRDEAKAFARWAGIITISFVVLIFVCADFQAR